MYSIEFFCYRVAGSYQSIGKLGLTLLGCKNVAVYQLLLYRTKDDVQCKVKMSQAFQFTVMDNNYASFYSENHENFSVMFDSALSLRSFSREVSFYSS